MVCMIELKPGPPPDLHDKLEFLPSHPRLRWGLIALATLMLLFLVVMTATGREMPDPISPGIPYGLGTLTEPLVS